MKKNEKIIAGIAAGAAVVALFLIPKTRKMITDAACSVTGSVKKALGKAEGVVSAHA